MSAQPRWTEWSPATATVATCLLLASCGGGGGSDGAGGPPPPTFTQFAAPEDPTLLATETAAGERMSFYGEKDDEGLATALRSLRFQTPEQVEDNTATWVHFGDDGLIRRFEGEGGSIIDFEQLSDTEYLISAVTPDGEIQANTVVDTTQPAARRAGAVTQQAQRAGEAGSDGSENLAPRGGRSIALATDYSQAWQSRHPGRSLQQSGDNTAPVTAIVTECNDGRAVDDAEVFFSAGAPGDSLPPTYLGIEDGTRRYRASIPLGNAPLSAEAVRDACLSTGTLLGTACDASDELREVGAPVFCAAAAGAIDTLVGGPTGEGAFIFAECQAGFFAVEGYCTANKASPQQTANFICDNIGEAVVSHPGVRSELDRNQLTVQAHANLPGRGRATSAPVTLNPFTEEYPTFFADYGGSIAIDELSTAPAAPEVGEDYVVTVQLACSAGSSVTVEVEGSDGFSDRAEFMPSNDEPLTVAVPGGRESLRDVIRVLAVSQEPGPFGFLTASRDTVVVFEEEEEETPPEPPDDGPDDPAFDFSQVTTGTYELRIGANGTFFPDDTAMDPMPASRNLARMESVPRQEEARGQPCPRTDFQQFDNLGFAFRRIEQDPQTAQQIFLSVDTETCMNASTMVVTSITHDSQGRETNLAVTVGEFMMTNSNTVAQAEVVDEQNIVYRLSGQALCNALSNFDFDREEQGGEFSSDTPVCEPDSVLEITLSH